MGRGAKNLANKTRDAINKANSDPSPQNEANVSRLTNDLNTVRENKRANQRAANGF